MSMVCFLEALSPKQINALTSRPALAGVVVRWAMDQAYSPKTLGLPQELSSIAPLDAPSTLDTAWHILHYLMTGHVDGSRAPGDALMTGTEIGDDVGYGPPRLHSPPETQAFSAFIAGLDMSHLSSRIDYARMVRAGVYGLPGGGRRTEAENTAEIRELVGDAFPALRSYVAAAANSRKGLLTWLS